MLQLAVMTTSLKEAFTLLRRMPDDLQDQIAVHLIRYANEDFVYGCD